MIQFLLKGLWRDKSRSLIPVIIVAVGVMLTVFLHAYINGFMGDTIEINARFGSGHVKVITKAYSENMDIQPLDLALMDTEQLLEELSISYPDYDWTERIRFGGLADIPDAEGETAAQGPLAGLGIHLLDAKPDETDRLGLSKSLVRGQMPAASGQVLLSETFATRVGLLPGDMFTLIGTDMYGGMTMYNFILSGTVRFGVESMDRGTMIADINDVRNALNMSDAATEILGFHKEGFFNNERESKAAAAFNALAGQDEFDPLMLALSQQGTMGQYVSLTEVWTLYISMVFVFAMSLVLWNAGLLGGLRRYGEIGVRLAMGETKSHVYGTMIWESVFVGLLGSILGTMLGLLFAWLLQTYGINISGMMDGASMMMPDTIRARITPPDFYLGFIPGLLSTIIGTMLSGIGIFKRQTASLFKELEA